MNAKQALGNGASAANQETKWRISDPFPGARVFLTTCKNIYPNIFKLNLRPQIKKMSKIKTF